MKNKIKFLFNLFGDTLKLMSSSLSLPVYRLATMMMGDGVDTFMCQHEGITTILSLKGERDNYLN